MASNNKECSEMEKDANIESEIKKTQNMLEFQTKTLNRLKTIKTGKRKILDILRQNSEMMDKSLMAQLNDRYNDFVLQETEILEILKRTMGLSISDNNEEKTAANDPEIQKIMSEIANVNSQLAKVRARNIELEKQVSKNDLNATTKKRDTLSKRVYELQQNNVEKKQLLNKLILENPNLVLECSKKNNDKKPDLDAYMNAVQSTPGTSKEFDEIARRIEQLKLRKERMGNIREKLAQASSTQLMDDAYHSALQRIDNLKEIRKVLEETSKEENDTLESPHVKKGPDTSVELNNVSAEENDEIK